MCLVSLAGCWRPNVTRLVDGQPIAGRYLAPAGYAAYARGALAEARGDDEQALEAFGEALDADDESVELWTRVAALQCKAGRAAAARESFAEAEELEPRYEPLWRAQARCAQAAGDWPRALEAARAAVRLDAERLPTVLLVAELFERTGEIEQARRWYRTVVVRWPQSTRGWREFERFCDRAGDPVGIAWARRGRAALELRRGGAGGPVSGQPESARTVSRWRDVDLALRSGDLAKARVLARRARLDPRQLAARAVFLGQPTLAMQQAAHLLAADPADTDSRLAAALGADLLGRSAEVMDLVVAPIDAQPPSPSGRLALAELLRRHVNDEASRAWLSAAAHRWGPLSADAESAEMVDALRGRLESAPSAPGDDATGR